MTPRRPADSTIAKYLRELCVRLDLDTWAIGVDPNPLGWRTGKSKGSPHGSWAQISVHQNKAYARIEIATHLFAESLEEQRLAFVHELLHIHLAPYDWTIFDALPHIKSPAARAVIDATHQQRSERVCDDLAVVMAPNLPLPPWKSPHGKDK